MKLFISTTFRAIKKTACFIALLLLLLHSNAQTASGKYDIVWNSPSQNAGASMPCGGGDIGMNVWVENGDLLIYVARSGNFDENNALMKTGRIRLQLSPNPFTGKSFKQQLHLKEGYVTVEGISNGVKATVTIWADVFKPVAHFDISASKKIDVTATYESWRFQDRVMKPRENFGNSWKWAAPKNNVYKRDITDFDRNGVLFYHYNSEKTIFDTTVIEQGLDVVKKDLYNPLRHLAFGGFFYGQNFLPSGNSLGFYENTDYKGWQLKTKKASTHQALQLYLHNAQVEDIAQWKQALDSLQNKAGATAAKSFTATKQWWANFWNRSFIEINNNDTASKGWEVARNYQLFRYMLACNAHSAWPTKFNGGLFTVDPVFTDTTKTFTPDFRNWGGGLHTMQNQRLVYYPMIKNGDWDLMQPQFDFYLRILKNAELRSKVYWNHGGACFTEQMENYGLPDFAEYGTKRPADFDKGVEYNNWLEYLWDTVLEFCSMMLDEYYYTGKNIDDKIPFIKSCLQFFDEHYQYLAKQRGEAPLDSAGHLKLFPGSGAETFKRAYNASSTIAALETVSFKLVKYYSDKLLAEHADTNIAASFNTAESIYRSIPPLEYRNFQGNITIAPAKSWERINNTESPQLYPVFPWRIYGVGKPGLDTALNTWNYDTSVIKFRSYIGWKQDNIWAACLGLTKDAWELTSQKLQNSGRRFPAFWGPGFDWTPDHNWGGSGMIGLQEMLLQENEKQILILPSWPKQMDIHFKLHATGNTTVEVNWKKGRLVQLNVQPATRLKDVILDGKEASTLLVH
ncbi:MAG: hypothetical protein JST86_18800 [Bacteroidetes bacterium]|nr:hypothetical protein [Bacteroidota bacterium]